MPLALFHYFLHFHICSLANGLRPFPIPMASALSSICPIYAQFERLSYIALPLLILVSMSNLFAVDSLYASCLALSRRLVGKLCKR